MSIKQKSLLLVAFILIIDQILKVYIKTTMMLGEEFPMLGNWFIIHFTENNGMAFGMEFGGEWGKMALSIFRIVAIVVIFIYMFRLIRQSAPSGVILGIALILAGAIGNIIDSAFYGIIFDHSYGQVASIFPESGGYSSFLHGRVVDMFYFPIIHTTWPSWVPFFGNSELIFFRPVFNIADSSITTGVLYILIFQRKFFAQQT